MMMLSRIRARNVCHVYLDYATAYVVVSTIPLLLALGWKNNSSTDDDARTNNNIMSWPLIGTAMLGGTLLSIGNLSFQWATAVYGAPLTTILAMQASLTVILGTSLNYVLEPTMTKRPGWLLLGVNVFLSAIALATVAQIVYADEQQQQGNMVLPRRSSDDVPEHEIMGGPHGNHVIGSPGGVMEYSAVIELPYGSSSRNNNNNKLHPKQSDSFTIVDPTEQEEEEECAMEARHRNMTGLVVALMGGLAFGFFSPAFNIAVNDPFHWSSSSSSSSTTTTTVDTDKSLLVFYANLWFSLAFGAASVIGNLVLLKYELHGQSLSTILWTYLTLASWRDRRVALLAGVVCAAGNVLQFHGGQLVGYATADLVQAYPLVSTVWDILWFGEFAHVQWCCSRLSVLLVCMYLAYLAGIVLLAVSSMD